MRIDFQKLTDSIDWSQEQLQTPREKRREAVKQLVGKHYSQKGSDVALPVNYIELALNVYRHQLAARSPRALIKTENLQLRPWAYSMSLALEQLTKEIDFDATLREVVVDAMLGVGIVKVGLSRGGETVLDIDVGQPYADRVSMDDFFVDMSAKSLKAAQYYGNDYWLPLEDVEEMYGSKAPEAGDVYTNISESGNTKVASITRSEHANLYKDLVHLRDVWLPRENKMLTYAVTTRKILAEIEWDGPEEGPYHILGFNSVPDQLLPLPPVALWRDMHELANNLFRKLANQAMSKKRVATFTEGDDKAVESFKAEPDGGAIRWTGQKPENVDVGGIDNPTLAFFLQVKELVSYLAGNLDSLGGLAPSSSTIGQDKLIAEANNARISSMRSETVKFIRGIYRSLAWYEWTDPVRERKLIKSVARDVQVEAVWSEETREGEFIDYNFDIDVYSMQDQSPGMKLQRLTEVMQSYVLPLLPVAQQQGGQVDVQDIMRLIAEWTDVPELSTLIQFPEGAMIQPPISGNPEPSTTKPQQTTRKYVRENRPASTPQSRANILTRTLMNEGVQPKEQAIIGG